jgi:hypothetical protein
MRTYSLETLVGRLIVMIGTASQQPAAQADTPRWLTGGAQEQGMTHARSMNDAARQVPIVPRFRTAFIAQRAKRQADCPYASFGLDRRGHAVKIIGFWKA